MKYLHPRLRTILLKSARIAALTLIMPIGFSGAFAADNNPAVGDGVQDTQSLSLVHDNDRYILEFKKTTRRQVIGQLLQEGNATASWLDTDYAVEVIDGRFVGSIEEILNRVLAGGNYVVAYNMNVNPPSMVNITVHGREIGSNSTGSVGSQSLETRASVAAENNTATGGRTSLRASGETNDNGIVGVSSIEELMKKIEE